LWQLKLIKNNYLSRPFPANAQAIKAKRMLKTFDPTMEPNFMLSFSWTKKMDNMDEMNPGPEIPMANTEAPAKSALKLNWNLRKLFYYFSSIVE